MLFNLNEYKGFFINNLYIKWKKQKQRSKWTEYDKWELQMSRIENNIVMKLSKVYPILKFNDLEKQNNDIYSWNNIFEYLKIQSFNH